MFPDFYWLQMQIEALILALSGWLPTTWTGFIGACTTAGIIIGSVIAFFATRSERKRVSEAHAETNRVYEQTIKAQDGFIRTLKETDAQALAVMTSERDSYKTRSHDLAGELNVVTLKMKEYEMRPDLTTLYHSQQTWHQQREEFYIKMFASQERLLDAQNEICANQKQMSTVLQELSEMLVQKLGLDRDAVR